MRNYVIALPEEDHTLVYNRGVISRTNGMVFINMPIEAFYDPLNGKDRPDEKKKKKQRRNDIL